MTKIRRGGYVFVTWKGDHPPRHVHVYRDEMFLAKWDLERSRTMEGTMPLRAVRLIRKLVGEGRL